MIQSLTIRNFVLIENLSICFRPGMQVLSGETGAGKSIVVDAVNLILGGRSDRNLIRTGCDKASVEAVFDMPKASKIPEILQRELIDPEGENLTLYREITANGKNVCRICGILAPVSVLREIGAELMDIHGQHEHQFLMNPEMHLNFLDLTGDKNFQESNNRVAMACESFLKVHRQYARMKKENDQKQHRIEELEKGLKELHAAKLKDGEEEKLQAENLKLRNAEKIISALRSAYENLSCEEKESSSLEKIRLAASTLKTLFSYDEHIKNIGERCENAFYELEEASYEISQLIESMEYNPSRVAAVEERLDLIRRLERKYGSTVKDVLDQQRAMEQEYERLCSMEDQMEELGRTHKQLLAAYRTEAGHLTESRKQLAADFEKRMTNQLKDLGMEKTVFSVAFEEREGNRRPMPKPTGDDQINFLISPNPGEPLKPLDRIASGGELSRIMLAMKALEAEGNGVECMVFDEIDTGISGHMAQVVAEKMHAIARNHQVICVTHLPQIAASADEQYLVYKYVSEDRTHTGVTHLDQEGRILEVARMISGAEGSGTDAAAYARSMIEAFKQQKSADNEKISCK